MASHNKKYNNDNAEVIIALKDKAGHIHELEDRYIRERFDDEVRTRENMFNTLSTILQNLYDEDSRIEGKFDVVIKDKLQDYFVFLGTFSNSGGGENAAANISNLNLNHSTILLYIYETNKVGIIYNFLRNDGFFQLLEMKGSKFFRYFKWNTDKTSLTLQNTFEGANIKAGWNNYTSKPFFEIGNKNSGTPYLNIFPLHAGGIVSYNIETLINLVNKYSLYSENGSTKFTTEEIQNWSMPDSPTLLNIIKNLYEKNNTYKSLLTSATNTITTLRADLNDANSKLSQVSQAQYNDKLQQDLTIQGLHQAYQYLQEQLELNFSQDAQRYDKQTGIDNRQNEIINELLSYHTETIIRGTPTETSGPFTATSTATSGEYVSLQGVIEIPYNPEYMYITDTQDGDGQVNDTLYINSSYLDQLLSQYGSNIPYESSVLYKITYNGNNYYYANQESLGIGDNIPSPWPSGDNNWVTFIQSNRESDLYKYGYITMPISWERQGSYPTFRQAASNATTSIIGPEETGAQTTPRSPGAGTPSQEDINTQTINTQITSAQTTSTQTLPISGAPVTPGRPTRTIAPTETEVQTPTATLSSAQTTSTQTINTETMPSGYTRTITPTETEVQTTSTQTINTETLVSAPTIAPTGRPASYSLPSNSGYQYVYEGMTGVNISESSVYINPAIYSNLSENLIAIKHSDESYEYCDFIGSCPDGIFSGYYTYNRRISNTSNIVTEAPRLGVTRPATTE